MRLNLTKQEYINFHEWTINIRKYFISEFDKIICFHGNQFGVYYVNKFILWFYYLRGYKFISCYPNKVKRRLGFGQFIWPEYNGEINAVIGFDENRNYQVDVIFPE